MFIINIIWLKIEMVYCSKCGFKNQDDAIACASCAANLSVNHEAKRTEYEDMCFGRRGSGFWGIFVGAMILLFGVTMLLQQLYGIKIDFWPIVIVAIGILVIWNALSRRSRQR